MTHRPATRVDHGAEHGRDAAGRVGQRKKIREVEFADHREMLLHGYRISACTMSQITVTARSAVISSLPIADRVQERARAAHQYRRCGNQLAPGYCLERGDPAGHRNRRQTSDASCQRGYLV